MAAVLLVEDDPDAQEILSKHLRRAGHEVIVATNGRQAIGALSDNRLAVVILDYKLPEMDGISFLEVIRCYLRWQTLPVILLTGYGDGRHIEQARLLGVRRTFLKADYNIEELLAEIAACEGGSPSDLGPPTDRGLPLS